MSLDHLLLGTLREPASGYDLKGRFETVFRHFWPAELSQIYRTLRRLEDEGLLSSRPEASARGPERRVYHTTAKGRARLRQWLAAGPEVREDRHAFVAQVFFLDELKDLDATRRFLAELQAEFAMRRAELERVAAEWQAADPRYPDGLSGHDLHARLSLTLGLAKYDAIASWARTELARLAERTDTPETRHADAV